MKFKQLFLLLVVALNSKLWANETAPLFYDGKGFFTYRQAVDEEILPNGKLKVVSFFDYDCASCVAADDNLKLYAKHNSEKIELVRYPYFKNGKIFVARLHAAFEVLGRPELSDLYLFESEGKKGETSLTENEAAIEKWLEQHQVDVASFRQLLNSDQVKTKLDEYAQLYRKYKPITAPFVSINGKYVLISSTLFNDDYTFAVLDHLFDNQNNPEVLGYVAPKQDIQTTSNKDKK